MFGAYSSLFTGNSTPPRARSRSKSPKTAISPKTMIEEIAAARSSGVDDPPPVDKKAARRKARDGGDNIPAGYTYFGQLVVHDLTNSIMVKMRGGRKLTLKNLSTPTLDLDTIYGDGPKKCPHLYQPAYINASHGSDDNGQHLFWLGRTAKAALPENWRQGYGLPFDLPRVEAGYSGMARAGLRVGITPLVHDDRNDDNLVLAQLTALFILAHNTVASYLSQNGDPTKSDGKKMSNSQSFDLARHFVLKAYRRIVIYDFLRRLLLPDIYELLIAGKMKELMAGKIKKLAKGKIESDGHVPVEFTFGVARVGHAMIRASYTINDHVKPSVSGLGRLMSFSGDEANPNLPLPADWVIDWRRFLDIENEKGIKPQNARRISPFLAPTFVYSQLATRPTGLEGSLSFHDLWRCYQLDLPTGQDYATLWFGEKDSRILRDGDMLPTQAVVDLHPADNLRDALKKHPNFLHNTPLSYYLLQEAAVHGCNGRYLGPLGSCIYAATIIQALDDTSVKIPDGQSGLAFKDIVDEASIKDTGENTGIKTLPQLLAILDLPDSKLRTVIVNTLRPTGGAAMIATRSIKGAQSHGKTSGQRQSRTRRVHHKSGNRRRVTRRAAR
jgi:hypothetical protein